MPGRVGSEPSGRNADPVSREELQTEIDELRTVLRDASGRLLDLQRGLNRLGPRNGNRGAPGDGARCGAFTSPNGADRRGSRTDSGHRRTGSRGLGCFGRRSAANRRPASRDWRR